MNSTKNILKILFLCTGNSCRSQMAEGWARHLKSEVLEAFSAGSRPHALDPRAVKAMAEAGVDISGHKSKHLDSLGDVEFDYVITLCDNAQQDCPYFPARTARIHAPFDDPPRLALGSGTEEEALEHYRRVRDEIRTFVERMPENLAQHRG